jgi:cleavage and polyadenylation specificity factor subunit 1
MFDEETGLEPKVFSASLIDPFLLLVRDDASIYVARCDDDNDLEEIEREDDRLLAIKWLSGCLYRDKTGAFANTAPDKASKDSSLVYMFLLSTDGALFVSCVRG